MFTAKSTGGAKKTSPYNRFMKAELARLKEKDPDMKHADRCVEDVQPVLRFSFPHTFFNPLYVIFGNYY